MNEPPNLTGTRAGRIDPYAWLAETARFGLERRFDERVERERLLGFAFILSDVNPDGVPRFADDDRLERLLDLLDHVDYFDRTGS